MDANDLQPAPSMGRKIYDKLLEKGWLSKYQCQRLAVELVDTFATEADRAPAFIEELKEEIRNL